MNEVRTALSVVLASHRLPDREEGRVVARKAISSMMTALRGKSIEDRTELRKALTNEEVALLHGVAFGAAVNAIVDGDPTVFADALFALMVEGGLDDARETRRMLSLVSHAATKIRFDLPRLYHTMRHLAPDPILGLLDHWFSRPPDSISSMAYRESKDKYGRFTFQSTIGRG